MLMVVAPAATARSTTSARKSGSVRAASSAEYSTSSKNWRAYATPCSARLATSSRDMCLAPAQHGDRAGANHLGDPERPEHFEKPFDPILPAGDLEDDGGGREVHDSRAERLADAQDFVALVVGGVDLHEREFVDHR